MGSILVHHTVPILGGGLVFTFWLPGGTDEAINLHYDDMTIQVWLDRTCIGTPPPEELTDDLIKSWTNMPVTQLYVDVRCEAVSTELAAFIGDNAEWPKRERMLVDSPDPERRRLALEYQNLGVRVLSAVLHVVNRVVAWAYAERGQYWLEERDIESSKTMMMSRNNEFNAQARIDSGSWVRWCPPFQDSFVVRIGKYGLRSDDWLALGEFLQGERNPNLVGELLSNAEALLSQGDNRSALIEGVSALEVAFHKFAGHPSENALRDRYNVLGNQPLDRLKRAVDHLGFSTSVTYLLPLILEKLPGQAYAISCEAITERGNVVHGGQREVSYHKVRRYLTGIHQLAGFLLESATTSIEDARPGSTSFVRP